MFETGFGKKKIVKDISANTLQTFITQLFGLVIFYFTSRYLAKEDFGEYNWSMAVGTTIITIASLGLDVVFIKRIALNENILVISGIHFFHTLLVGILFSVLVLLIQSIFPSFTHYHPLFFIVFVHLSLINISNSFRLCLIGLETYKSLAVMALITNVFKFVTILGLYFIGYFTITNVVYAFIVSTSLELVLGYFFVSQRVSAKIKPVLKVKEYKYFIIESLPQLGVVFFDSALARIDWILLGIISTASITAEYSFAYRMYESSKLPLIIISPILLTRFTKLLRSGGRVKDKNIRDIQLFYKVELFIVMLIPIILVCSWAPLMDYFTNNKYGQVNTLNYILLAGCVPLHCVSNFLWSIGFAQGQLKAIMYITIVVALINFGLNYFLIPFYGSNGAATAFLASTVIQTLLYVKYMNQKVIKLNIKVSIIAFINAVASILIAKSLTNNIIFVTVLALGISVVIGILTRQLNIKEIKTILVKSE